MFKANLENNVSKAIDQLSGICSGILADGVVNEREAAFFADWVRKFAPFEPVWPFTDILARVERIFADGRCDDEEREELKGGMKKAAVIHRTKHDKTTRRKAGKLADHPAMKELSRMIETGEVNRDRTLAYLKKGRKS
jgi:hypothetical protein